MSSSKVRNARLGGLELVYVMLDERRRSGGAELSGKLFLARGNSLRKDGGGCGSWDVHEPMRAFYLPRPRLNGGCRYLAGVQLLYGEGGYERIANGLPVSHFVEVGVLDGASVYLGFGFGKNIVYGVHVVFTGHMHISDATTFSTDYSSIVDISTGSTVTYPFPYREVTIDDNCSTLSM